MPSFNTEILKAVKQRRSIYHLGNQIPYTDEEITDLVAHSIKYAPTPFNCQSARVVILLKKEHTLFWELVKDVFRPTLPPEKMKGLARKIDQQFAPGYGTILFFEDRVTVDRLQRENPLYEGRYKLWSNQSSGMLQYSIWISFKANGMGASLQHYHPPIEKRVREQWNIPEEWEFMAQMPFGNITAPPDEKTFLPMEKRLLIYK